MAPTLLNCSNSSNNNLFLSLNFICLDDIVFWILNSFLVTLILVMTCALSQCGHWIKNVHLFIQVLMSLVISPQRYLKIFYIWNHDHICKLVRIMAALLLSVPLSDVVLSYSNKGLQKCCSARHNGPYATVISASKHTASTLYVSL